MDDHLVGVLSNIGVISFVALSAYLLLLTGEISFGQQAFFAIGAYAAGIATAMWGWPLGAALICGAAVAATAALLVGLPTLRLHGLYFAVATLAFAEMVRILFELFRYQVSIDGELVGPNGADGFGNIRYTFQNNIGAVEYMLFVYALLAAALLGFWLMERARLGVALRMIGEDEVLAATSGIPVARFRMLAAGMAGALAGVGGGLYAHLTTYIEPRIFDVMLGVHSLAYGLIGGLGTAFGPLLGVLVDIGLLESTRLFSGYRMIVFGGLVAVLLIFRPRGLLDERVVHWLGAVGRRRLALDKLGGGASMRIFVASILTVLLVSGAHGADVRAKADVSCRPAGGSLQYECAIKLSDARTDQPLSGVTLMVGADMPSMPMAHNVRPVRAQPGTEPGSYRARLALEMTGVWAVRLDLSGPVRDRVISVLRFEEDKVAPATSPKGR
jgi:branched-chain amino acid transport system permease protein